jgi:hypothetical protein
LCAAALLAGCRLREPPEVVRDRTVEAALVKQVADLEALVKRAEKGELGTTGRIAIGIGEETSKALLDASLPREATIAERLKIRIESAQAFFRGGNAMVMFSARAFGTGGRIEARLEIAARLAGFRVVDGKLSTGVEILHFTVLDASPGTLGATVLESMVRANLDTISGLLPGLEIPVRLEHAIEIGGIDEGVVSVRPGTLPLEISLAEVLPVGQRLWLLLDAKAGPWIRGALIEAAK